MKKNALKLTLSAAALFFGSMAFAQLGVGVTNTTSVGTKVNTQPATNAVKATTNATKTTVITSANAVKGVQATTTATAENGVNTTTNAATQAAASTKTNVNADLSTDNAASIQGNGNQNSAQGKNNTSVNAEGNVQIDGSAATTGVTNAGAQAENDLNATTEASAKAAKKMTKAAKKEAKATKANAEAAATQSAELDVKSSTNVQATKK